MINNILQRARLWETFQTGVAHGWEWTQIFPIMAGAIGMFVLPISAGIGVLRLIAWLVF